jgi:glycosyltransferase involved in cell wall biosynthesis
MGKLSELSDKLVVMSHKAFDFLKEIYAVPEEKIVFIHHGIPDTPFIDPSFNKDKFGVEGKKVLLTFGLLSPNKGIENVLQALPAVINKHPDVAYIILGATHPHILKQHGDAYRIMLQQLVRKLDIGAHVIFQNRFVELNELCEFLGIADIYTTPYLEEAQITSGTLAYAMGTGKAIISTPYWYATEMLAEGRGRIVPFNDPEALAEQIIDLLDNDVERHAIRKKAYTFTREAVWKEVARNYLQVFSEVRQNRTRNPRPRHSYVENIKAITNFELPEIKLDHLKALPMIPASCSMPTIPSPIAPMATAPTTMPGRCWLPPWVNDTCRQTAGGSIHSVAIISDFFCMPSMKKKNAFAIS